MLCSPRSISVCFYLSISRKLRVCALDYCFREIFTRPILGRVLFAYDPFLVRIIVIRRKIIVQKNNLLIVSNGGAALGSAAAGVVGALGNAATAVGSSLGPLNFGVGADGEVALKNALSK